MKLPCLQNNTALKSISYIRSFLGYSHLPTPRSSPSSRVRAEHRPFTYIDYRDSHYARDQVDQSRSYNLLSFTSPFGSQRLRASLTSVSSFTSRSFRFYYPAYGTLQPRAFPNIQSPKHYFPDSSSTAQIHTSATSTATHLHTAAMAEKPTEDSESSLSPAPEDLVTPIETEEVVKTAINGRKRKAETTVTTTVKTTKRTKKAAVEVKEENATAETPRKGRAAAKKVEYEEDANEDEGTHGKTATVTKKTIKKVTRTKKSKESVPPLEERTADTKLRIGAHVSVAGGVHNAIPNLLHIGANAFAMFMKNQRKWDNPDMDPEHASLFISGCKDHNIEVGECCLPHGSYLVNLAHPDAERKKQAYDSFHDDLVRCNKLGIRLYNFHPGNANATTREEGIKLIAENLNRAHADPETGSVVTVLETMASLGNTIGGTFEDLAAIISHVDKKDRVGVCLDTCHVFAAGYDLRTPASYAAVMQQFDEIIGLKYLVALHVNDSKAPLASYRDLHARIGTGYLGLRVFHNLVNDARLQGLPMVLETPVDVVGADGKKAEDKSIWAGEIKMLERLVGMDVESEEFGELETRLHEQGEGERERIGGQVDRKKVKDAKPKVVRKKKKGGEGVNGEGEGEEEVKPKKAPVKRKAAAKKKVESEEEEEDGDDEE